MFSNVNEDAANVEKRLAVKNEKHEKRNFFFILHHIKNNMKISSYHQHEDENETACEHLE